MKDSLRIAILMAFMFIIVFEMLRFGEDKSNRNDDSNSVEWTGKQYSEAEESTKNIAIPGQSKMLFKAGETAQKVNIYNPEENDCYMIFTLQIDDETIWKSGECLPGYGYYDIDLDYPLKAGTYNASLIHECFRGDTKLNSAKMEVEIVVK